MNVSRPGHRLPRLLCRILGHEQRVPFPGDRAYCVRCGQKWGKWSAAGNA